MGLYEHLKEQKKISGQVDSGLKAVFGKPQDGALTMNQIVGKLYHMEIVKDFDGTYYANMSIDGDIKGDLPEYVSYRKLKAAIKKQYGIELPNVGALTFEKLGRKQYAQLNGIVEN